MPPMRQPGAGGMADMRSFRRRRAIIAGIVLLLIAGAVAAILLAGGGDDEREAAPASAEEFDGTVYVESNVAEPDGNSVLAFRYREGSFKPLSVREYPTGGTGSADLTNAGPLDAEQQIVVNEDKTLLFAVNAGSDTVAVFRIAADGSLTAVEGSPFPSGGSAPAAVGVAGDTLFVANKAEDGVRDLGDEVSSYASFRIAADGKLTQIGESVEVPSVGDRTASPTQVYPIPGKPLMVATELQGPWRMFRVADDGGLETAPGSPHPLDAEVFAPVDPRPRVWAQGITAHPSEPLLYASVANLRKLVAYEYDDEGRLELVHESLNEGSLLPCWTEIDAEGTRLYTGNAGSGSITVYDIESDPRNPRRLQQVKLKSPGNPWNFEIDPSGRYLFMVNMRAIRQIPAGRGNTLHSFRIEPDGKLTEMETSPVEIPVPLDTNPWGLAIVERG
jgi:6-phosphogluconolactonase (cycloisomerase 2 family)